MPTAYSYMRFSSPAQAEGDSIRRQSQAAKSWCKANGFTLDASTSYADKGISGFKGKHRSKGALAAFLAEIEASRIKAGSVLLIENLDRLSREGAYDALPVLCGIVNSGIVVVTLSPREMRYERGQDLTGLILAVVEFGRGHSESARKADLSSAAWMEKQRLAREEGTIMTRQLPSWVSERGGKLVLNERAKLVRRMFTLATNGYGLGKIVQALEKEGTKPFGRAKEWSKACVHKILTGRSVVGEHRPCKDGKPTGEAIIGYYPAVLDETSWLAAQAAIAQRKNRGGRIGGTKESPEVANLFSGLLRDARTGNKMLIAWQSTRRGEDRGRRRVLINAGALEGREPSISFPYDAFERSILRYLSEIRPADVLGEEPESESATLAAELASVRHRINQIEDELTGDDGDDVSALANVIKKLHAKQLDLQAKLIAAQQSEARPQSAAWQEAKTLLDVAKDEASRLRLRGLVCQIVEDVMCLVVPHAVHKSHRYCVAQINFAGGTSCDVYIHYKAAGNGRKEKVEHASISLPLGIGTLDLRNKKHVATLEEMLRTVEIDESSLTAMPLGNNVAEEVTSALSGKKSGKAAKKR